MSWHWEGTGGPADALERTFPTQGDAETWLGETYPQLLEAGYRAVSLFEEGRLVYGPMPLEPEPG